MAVGVNQAPCAALVWIIQASTIKRAIRKLQNALINMTSNPGRVVDSESENLVGQIVKAAAIVQKRSEAPCSVALPAVKALPTLQAAVDAADGLNLEIWPVRDDVGMGLNLSTQLVTIHCARHSRVVLMETQVATSWSTLSKRRLASESSALWIVLLLAMVCLTS